MRNLVCNRLMLGSITLWSVDFSLDLGTKAICSLNSVLYFYLFSFFNLCIFMFVDNMNLWVLIAEMLGYAFHRIRYHIWCLVQLIFSLVGCFMLDLLYLVLTLGL